VISTRQPLSELALDNVYQQCLIERGLDDGELAEIPLLAFADDGDEATKALTLTRLHDVANVNHLAPEQEIAFNTRLTVLFGENATGKSGYARILKRAANVRSAEEILPDITAPESTGPPTAVIDYRLGDEEGFLIRRSFEEKAISSLLLEKKVS